jgi:hypothetical protein
MNKSVLIIDTPKSCGECPICASWQSSAFSVREYWCTVSENISVDPDDKPKWCPLKTARVVENHLDSLIIDDLIDYKR